HRCEKGWVFWLSANGRQRAANGQMRAANGQMATKYVRYRCSKPVQIGRLEEEPAADGRVISAEVVRHDCVRLGPAFLVKRAVAGVEDGAGDHFVRRQQVRQETMARAVELLEQSDQQMLVELIGGFEIH